jgi:hypothetical protein
VPGEVLTGVVSAVYPVTSDVFFLVDGSWPVPLPADPGTFTVKYIDLETTVPTADCPGEGHAATAGVLCVYGTNTENLATVNPVSLSGIDPSSLRYGFSLDVFPQDGTHPGYIIASWAYKVA